MGRVIVEYEGLQLGRAPFLINGPFRQFDNHSVHIFSFMAIVIGETKEAYAKALARFTEALATRNGTLRFRVEGRLLVEFKGSDDLIFACPSATRLSGTFCTPRSCAFDVFIAVHKLGAVHQHLKKECDHV